MDKEVYMVLGWGGPLTDPYYFPILEHRDERNTVETVRKYTSREADRYIELTRTKWFCGDVPEGISPYVKMPWSSELGGRIIGDSNLPS